jgi:hypothetical protein
MCVCMCMCVLVVFVDGGAVVQVRCLCVGPFGELVSGAQVRGIHLRV